MTDNIEGGTWASLDPDITPALLRELAEVVCGMRNKQVV